MNPHSAHVGVTRVVGITHVLTRPTGGIVSGQAALLNLAGSTVVQMRVNERAALVIELPRSGFGGGRGFAFAAAPGGPGGAGDVQRARTRQLDSLRAWLRDAEAYAKAQEAYAKDRTLPRPRQDVVLASLVAAARGEQPVLFVADRAPDIREAIAFAREMKLRPIIMGGRDAWQVADLLKREDVPVLLGSVMDLPSREDDPFDANYAAPAKLAASGDAGAESRNLPYVAGMAAAHGLSKADALRAVTLWPAQILGVGDRLGSIEVGKAANLVVTTGDLLEARTDTRYLIIDGRMVPLDTKHSVLNEQFKDRP